MEANARAGRSGTLTAVDTPATEEDSTLVEESEDPALAGRFGDDRPRATRRWPVVVAAVLLVLATAAGVGGYLALQANHASAADNAANAAALAAAKDCVSATQPPNAAAIAASQQKLADCSTGKFGDQSSWYGEVLAQAYNAVDVRVRVPEMHAALERDNDDRSIDVLVVFRATVSQTGVADRENSYRVRVKMVAVNGQFKVAELDQVAK